MAQSPSMTDTLPEVEEVKRGLETVLDEMAKLLSVPGYNRVADAVALIDQLQRDNAALREGLADAHTGLEWALGIAAGVVQMGNPGYEQAGAAYERAAALLNPSNTGGR